MFLRCPTPLRRHSSRSVVAATALVASLAALTGLTAMSASAATTTAWTLTAPTSLRVPAKISTSSTAPAVGPSVPLPVFSKSFTSGGSSFTYQMVGTDPQGAAATTTVPDTITPLRFVFQSGGVMTVPPANLTRVTNSGLFVPKAFPGGTGQYGDIFMRTQFWKWINLGGKAWHVNMETPMVLPALTVAVPTGFGNTTTVNGIRVGLVDIDFFDGAVQNYIGAPAENVFTQLLANNIVLCARNSAGVEQCGIGGYHSATPNATGMHTYLYASWLNPAIFGSTFANIAPMSHELAEWLADPFVNNTVPFWNSPSTAPQYPCNNFLEVGDPLVGFVRSVGGLTYQEEAFVSWFTRTTPSLGWQNRFSWFGTFTSSSPSCTP